MRLKSELYKKEQDEIKQSIVNLLDLEHTNSLTLYELEQNKELQENIMNMIPEIRKYFSFNGMKAVGNPGAIKRPWLSIIKFFTKHAYTLETSDYHFQKDEKWIHTQKYVFVKK